MTNKEAIEFLKNMIDSKAVTLIDNDFTARYHIEALQMAIKALKKQIDFKEGYKQAIIDGQTNFQGLRGVLGFSFKKYDENFEMLPGEYIVLLEYKYDHEEQFTYELNILCIDEKERYFISDSYEGQEHFRILAYADINSFSRERLEYFSKYFLGGNTNV